MLENSAWYIYLFLGKLSTLSKFENKQIWRRWLRNFCMLCIMIKAVFVRTCTGYQGNLLRALGCCYLLIEIWNFGGRFYSLTFSGRAGDLFFLLPVTRYCVVRWIMSTIYMCINIVAELKTHNWSIYGIYIFVSIILWCKTRAGLWTLNSWCHSWIGCYVVLCVSCGW